MTARTSRLLLVVVAALGCGTSDRRSTPDSGKSGGGNAPRLFAGGRRTCLIRGGEIRCWGDASHGALGPAVAMSAASVPTSLPGIESAVELAFGEAHGCARLSDGSVKCWGANDVGQLGAAGVTGDSATPVAVAGVTGATAIAAGGSQTCAVTASGVRCWGGTLSPPSRIDAVALAVGAAHACAITRDRAVTCWGDSAHGQLGPPIGGGDGTIPGLKKVDEIAAAGDTTCARSGGAVLCWGDNAGAQLGDPAMGQHAAPRPVAGITDATAIGLGRRHACALRAGGEVVCWGGSDRGPFGYPDGCPEGQIGHEAHAGTSGVVMVFCAAPLPVPGISGAVALAHGEGHACALDRGGTVRCWGGEGYSELGNRDYGAAGSKEPIDVVFAKTSPRAAPQAALAVAAAGDWSCAILADRSVRCWGDGNLGQLGPQVKERSAKPVPIDGLGPVESLSMGPYHACALLAKDKGTARCWGYNDAGQLGDGSTGKRSAPVAPAGVPALAQIAVSQSSTDPHTCALDQAGEVWCWGGNQHGAANLGDKRPASPTPAKIAGVSGASQIASGDGASCALVKGAVLCWGTMRGLKETTTQLARPTRIAGLDKVAEIAMGGYGYCARHEDRSVTCWGRLSGDAERRTVALGGPVKSIAIAGSSLIAVLDSGWVMRTPVAEDQKPAHIPVPQPVQVSCATYHCCALDQNKRTVCWGSNGNGQLGNPDQGFGGETETPSPVAL
jgi:alpha-tubulin suppressor-like RCC1 family protein